MLRKHSEKRALSWWLFCKVRHIRVSDMSWARRGCLDFLDLPQDMHRHGCTPQTLWGCCTSRDMQHARML